MVVNGQRVATKFVKGGRIEATVPGALRSTPGQLVVRVEQAGIESDDTTIDVTPTTGPFIFSIAPTRIRQGEKKDGITVIGANFTNDLTAMLDGEQHTIKTATHRV